MNSLVILEKSGPVATITLNRPKRHNSLVPELLNELVGAVESLRGSPDMRVMILQANGHSFSTGGDVQAFYDHRPAIETYSKQVVGLLNEAILSFITLPFPIVAAVHGIVTGGSIGLVLASDIVLVAPEATFTPYYATVGYSPDGGWTAMLPALIGVRRAAEVLILDRPITASDAVKWGIANRVVSADTIRDQAQATAAAIVRHVPGSIRRSKALLWGSPDALSARLEEERRQFIQQIMTAEAQEGMAAFLKRRK
jgi:enoyl-CoA hydratase/carnithine racemase